MQKNILYNYILAAHSCQHRTRSGVSGHPRSPSNLMQFVPTVANLTRAVHKMPHDKKQRRLSGRYIS
jgi:hypothetical protein